jgi:hypothetical protein
MRRPLLTATLVLAAAASVWVFLAVDSYSHSVSDTLYGAAAPIGLVWLIAVAVIALVRRTMPNP